MSEYMTSFEKEADELSHEDQLEVTQSSLKRLITTDSLFDNLPNDVVLEEINAQVAVLQGKSITVTIYRYSESSVNIIVPQVGTTVLDLRKAVQRAFLLIQQRQRSKTKISWKYIWKNYFLQNVDTKQRLLNIGKPIAHYGVGNRAVLKFIKKRLKKSDIVHDE